MKTYKNFLKSFFKKFFINVFRLIKGFCIGFGEVVFAKKLNFQG